MSYVYRGTGTDTLTGDMRLEDIRRDITRHEGKGWKLPLRAGQVITVHGTPSAYRRHRRNGEEACEDCLQAEAQYWRDKQRQRRAS